MTYRSRRFSSFKCACVDCLNQAVSLAQSMTPMLHHLTSLFNKPKPKVEEKEPITSSVEKYSGTKKEVNDLIKDAISRGWTHELLKNSHHKLTWKHVTDKSFTNVVIIPGTPSDPRSFLNAKAIIKRTERLWPAPDPDSTEDSTETSGPKSWEQRYQNGKSSMVKSSSAVSEFFKFHNQHDGGSPATYEECKRGAELARAAHVESGQSSFLGLAARYENFANDKKPKEQSGTAKTQRPDLPSRLVERKPEPPLYDDPYTHPHFLGEE